MFFYCPAGTSLILPDDNLDVVILLKIIMKNKLFCLLSVLFFFSCQVEQNNYLEKTLIFADKNRSELEKVLFFYSKNPADSLKYKAAVFLIENMPGHFSYKNQEWLSAYYNELDTAVSLNYDNETNQRIIERISAKYQSYKAQQTVLDIQIITSEFLINNIEQAFAVWQNGEWATHVSFSDFCEYILPYKVTELQPLDNWREYAKEMLKGDVDLLHYCDLYNNSAFQAATSVSKEIIKLNQQDLPFGGIQSIPVKNIRTIGKMPFGACEDYSVLALAVMRSKGIPVMEDFTPQWPFQPQGHTWNVILTNKGHNMIFSAGSSNPGELHNPDTKMAKVFRRTYAINREIEKIHLSKDYVPPAFSNCHIKDVTDEYMVTSDVEIKIPQTFSNKYQYAYLAVFDNKDWIPVHYGKVSGKKVKFEKMGRNCMYLPVFYDEHGVVPFSSPFFMTSLRLARQYKINGTETQTISVYRKYFIASHCYEVGERMKGGIFEAANRADFMDAVLVYQIPDFTVQSGMVRIDTLSTLYRYWRYRGPDYSFCNVGELYFYQGGNQKPVYVKIIGTEGSKPINNKEVAFDGDPLTLFDSKYSVGGWVGLDFGKPVKIDHISYTPRGDGNDITPGDIYEFLYWSDDHWISLGKQEATDIKLAYENVPMNTIYWVRNLSRGRDERIFTYEGGKQVFW
jgi:hypothetical protein